ncbi:O-antigen ligase family protein [Halomonas dongshanensis]|uniref:O-antigen ligase family protein n=1 Tax=Halomonas dongshanensis TaxID=2890835 RepID=A0ABT2ED46_9GAMM|nr:O-antigen ligase family protein [Halomonas dongshanensis]MCS2609035.1 O-antigen ligase family protein [Halomonas dongshanensis]
MLSIEQYSTMLMILLALLGFITLSKWSVSPVVIFLPIFIFYLFLISLLFEGELTALAKVVALSLIVVLASFCAYKVSAEEFLKLLVVSLFLLLVFNVVLASFYPDVGVEAGKFSGDWKGVFDQKNALGRLSALLMVLATLLFISVRDLENKIFAFFVFVSAVFVVINSGSRTGFATGVLTSVLVLFFCLVYKVIKDPEVNAKVFVAVLFFEAFSIGVIILSNMEAVNLYSGNDGVSVFGQFISLTGRLTIWEYAVQHLQGAHLWVGYGLDNFWTTENFRALGAIDGMGDFYPEDSHNGYIDILIQGGVLGAFFYGTFIVFLLVSVLRANLNFVEFITFFTFISFFMISNISESYTTKSTNIVNFIFIYLSALVFLKSGKNRCGWILKVSSVKDIKIFGFALLGKSVNRTRVL